MGGAGRCPSSPGPGTDNARWAAASQASKKTCGPGASCQDEEWDAPTEGIAPPTGPVCSAGRPPWATGPVRVDGVPCEEGALPR